jgi:hypothetical protein
MEVPHPLCPHGLPEVPHNFPTYPTTGPIATPWPIKVEGAWGPFYVTIVARGVFEKGVSGDGRATDGGIKLSNVLLAKFWGRR